MYETQDLQIAAWLTAKGYQLSGIQRNGRRLSFRFDDPNVDAERTAFSFISGGVVEGKKLLDCAKTLKVMLHSYEDGRR
jgi:hypothetical protein